CYSAYLDPSAPSLIDHLPSGTVVLDFEPSRQLVDARTLLDETAMLAAAEAGGGELPRLFTLPTVTRLDDLGDRTRLTITAAEGSGDAIDLGWFAGEPLVGQPRALAGLAAKSDSAAIVFATEQDERLRALLDEAGGEGAPKASRVSGTCVRESDVAHRECLEREYAEGARAFASVENPARAWKCLGGARVPPLLSAAAPPRGRARGRARKVVQDVAEDLLK